MAKTITKTIQDNEILFSFVMTKANALEFANSFIFLFEKEWNRQVDNNGTQERVYPNTNAGKKKFLRAIIKGYFIQARENAEHKIALNQVQKPVLSESVITESSDE